MTKAHHALKNALHLGHAVGARRREGLESADHLLAYVSPLGRAHILLTGAPANTSGQETSRLG